MRAEHTHPIHLLSVLYKAYTRILRFTFLGTYSLSPVQFGFRRRLGTLDPLFIFFVAVHKSLAQNLPLYICFVDFTSAFDSVGRDLLFYKLLRIGVKGRLFAALHAIYKEVRAVVRGSGSSSIFVESCGVRQGCLLSPDLFSAFINDLAEELGLGRQDALILGIVAVFLLLYADDALLLHQQLDGLQSLISRMAAYCYK